MKVAIVGANGFIGSAIKQAVIQKGWQPIPILRNSPEHLFKEANAVVHSVGAISPIKQYKQLLNTPLLDIPKFSAQWVSILPELFQIKSQPSLLNLNLDPLKSVCSKVLKYHGNNKKPSGASSGAIPFIYLSGSKWLLSSNEYVSSKLACEQYLKTMPFRSVFIEPKFVAPTDKSGCTLRTGVQELLTKISPQSVVSVDAVAHAVCEAIEDTTIKGQVSHESLQVFDDVRCT